MRTPPETPSSLARALEIADAALASAVECLKAADRAHAIAEAHRCIEVAALQVKTLRGALAARARSRDR